MKSYTPEELGIDDEVLVSQNGIKKRISYITINEGGGVVMWVRGKIIDRDEPIILDDKCRVYPMKAEKPRIEYEEKAHECWQLESKIAKIRQEYIGEIKRKALKELGKEGPVREGD